MPTSPSPPGRTAVWAPTSRGSSCGSRSRSFTGGSRTTSSPQASRSPTPTTASAPPSTCPSALRRTAMPIPTQLEHTMSDLEPEGRLYIDGEFREAEGGRRFDVLNPSDESLVGTAADATPADVGDAVTAARRAADETSWGTDHLFRQRVLRQLQDALRKEASNAKELQIAE